MWKNKFDYIFVDLDGTIIEDKYRHYYCYKDIINIYGGKPLNIETYWALKRRGVSRKEILKASQFRGEDKDFLNLWLDRIEEIPYLEKARLKPLAKETLKQWAFYTDNIVLVTLRKRKENLYHQLTYFGLVPLFQEIIACDPLNKYSKFDSLKDKKFSKALFVGDTEIDVLTAEMLKIKCIGITNGLRVKEYLKTPFLSEEIYKIDIEELVDIL